MTQSTSTQRIVLPWEYLSEHRNLQSINLTTEELRLSKLPDKHLQSIWVEFESATDRKYTAVHVSNHPNGPYINLSGSDKDYEDFKRVEEIIARETLGNPKGDISERFDDICKIITLNEVPTQRMVADFVQRYKTHFRNVKIPVAYFHNVPTSYSKNPGIPLEKLTVE